MKSEHPHRRKNLLTGEWVFVSSHRTQRPWLGQIEIIPEEVLPDYDPDCYLCPGNRRASGATNPLYRETFVFDNDFSALYPPPGNQSDDWPSVYPFVAEKVNGLCRVVCFSPNHGRTLPELTQEQVQMVIQTWTEQTLDLGEKDFIQYVQIFENKGAMMGCSNPHPHSQIWATSHIPNEPALELILQERYFQENRCCLLCEYLSAEIKEAARIVAQNDHFTALVPYWAVWPFEILVISHRHLGALNHLKEEETAGLADIIRQVTTRYDNLFEISFPYSMGFHQTPADKRPYPGAHFHAHYYPPLLRSASIRKFMVGFEMLAMPQRDITPEAAAERLRFVPAIHYKKR